MSRGSGREGHKAISAEEIRKAPGSLLALDRNKDGKLTREEFAPPRRGALAMLDKDGDADEKER